MGYKCKHFLLQEWVGPEVYAKYGERCWEFLNPKILITFDEFREEFGSIVMNNWHDGGEFKYRGLRDPIAPQFLGSAPMSIHKFGGAGDGDPQNVTPQEMYARILARPERFQYLTCMENIVSTPTWIHADVRNHQKSQQILVVSPT